MALEVLVSEDCLGAVIGDLKSRRAMIQDIGSRGEARLVSAHAPLARLFGYSTDLRSLTKGRANFTMKFQAYDNLAASEA